MRLWVAITLAAVLCGCINAPAPSPLPGPDPVVVDTIDGAAAAGMTGYRERSAKVFETLAADLRAGKFATQTEFADEMERRTKAARLESFAALREAWQANNADEWDREADAVKCEQTARGFRR